MRIGGFLLSVAALMVIAVQPTPANSQTAYPSKAITILCSQPPGSGPDTMLRRFADIMGHEFGQAVVVQNQPGAGGALAAQTVARAAPDGYTLLLVLGAAHTILPAMQTLPYDPIADFTFISLLYVSSGVLLVPPDSPARNFAELKEALQKKGSRATYGSPAIGSPGHLQGALLAEKLGIKAQHVAYRGGSDLMRDLAGGLIDFAFLSTVQSIAPVSQNQARGIAVATDSRIKALPDLPTLKELGYGDVAVDSWFGIGGPKGLPPEVIRKIRAALISAAGNSAIAPRAEAEQVALIPGPEEQFQKLLAYDYERLGVAVRRLGIKPE
jgi:tripartite-type tricarboxylate transporter receptor subunit TctC